MKQFSLTVALSAILGLGLALAQDPPNSQYSPTVLLRNLKDPTSIAFRPDGKIYLTLKAGTITLYDPVSKTSTTAATLTTPHLREDGLHRIVVDPNFATNRWVYVYMSEISPGDTANVVARYQTDSVSGALITGSRATLLKVPYTMNSSTAEHNTGTLDFGPGGYLYVGLPDNTQNIFSGTGAGYAPRDTNRLLYDAQRSAANTNDLRGKILRIKPEANGTYSIPAGNLKDSINNLTFNPNWKTSEDDISKVRPEVFVMGLRHPFRITVDAQTGWLFWAEPGPNASADNASQGPRGYEIVALAKGPGNYGWPYCRANPNVIQKPGTVTGPFCYTEYNYSGAGTGGAMYVPTALRNKSKNNTGIVNLPPMRPASVWYPYNATGTAFPIFGSGNGSNAGMLGPLYHYNASLPSSRLPAVFDNHLFVVEWNRNLLYVAKLDAAGGVQEVRAFRDVAGARDTVVNGPIDIKIGPDGALYFVNWGSSTYPTNSGSPGSLVRLAYTGVQTAVSPQYHAAHLPTSRFEVLGSGMPIILPAGAIGLECFDLKGSKVWSYRRTDATNIENVQPPSGLNGVLRVRWIPE